jgi:hypothetical protein
VRRRLFTFFSAVSLLMCVGACALWVRSFSTLDIIGYVRDRGRNEAFTLNSSRGSIWLGSVPVKAEVDRGPLWQTFAVGGPPPAGVTPPWRTVRVVLGSATGGSSSSSTGVVVPHWLVAAVAGVAPARRLTRVLSSRRRARRGLCLACGYDLRESPERCPECGRATA